MSTQAIVSPFKNDRSKPPFGSADHEALGFDELYSIQCNFKVHDSLWQRLLDCGYWKHLHQYICWLCHLLHHWLPCSWPSDAYWQSCGSRFVFQLYDTPRKLKLRDKQESLSLFFSPVLHAILFRPYTCNGESLRVPTSLKNNLWPKA